jgi:hypothetical protein
MIIDPHALEVAAHVYRASLYDGLTGREPARVYTASDSELARSSLRASPDVAKRSIRKFRSLTSLRPRHR